ncbi:MAG: sigma-70 family RNA polymerase sigma factor [Bacteroidia bacterium]|nr:sigma-70 family RNA polymerase sigma factor [Bacteroidia bacterium]
MEETHYREYRALLRPIALRLLGNADDADDLVQETLLRWIAADRSGIENEQGYLVRALMNRGLNLIRDRKKRESHLPHIAPELLTDHVPARIEQEDSLSLGMLAMLEKLSPQERAVFMLKEIFSYSHAEIAELLGISEDNCRQLLSRARKHLREPKVRFLVDPDRHTLLYRSFLRACEGEDLSKLLEVLKEDIELDVMRPAAVLRGRTAVAGYLMQLRQQGVRYEWLWLRDLPVLVAYLYYRPVQVLILEGDEAGISRIEAHPQATLAGVAAA